MDEEKDIVYVREGFFIPPAELHFSFALSSGPGGQNVNKNATKVRLKWWPVESAAVNKQLISSDRYRLLKKAQKAISEDGSIQVVSDRNRTREANKRDCCEKLAKMLRTWLKKPKPRIKTKPTRASKERRLTDKKRTSQVKKNRQKPTSGD